ncbi:MAG: LUD domain-containing protein [Thermodesulfobacteriota bacterium]
MAGHRVLPTADPRRRAALEGFSGRLRQMHAAGLADPGLRAHLHGRVRAAKLAYFSDPARWLGLLAQRLEDRGVRVHLAADAAEARAIILGILQAAGAKRVVKGKSMTCEEIGLNPALEKAGVAVSETDLGEFIIQLAEEPPFHILGPAMHRDRGQIAELFAEKLGERAPAEPEALTALARRVLRRRFLAAEAGISGVNAAACEPGVLAIVTNEGNGRYVTGLPPLHIAVMGLEKAVPTLADLGAVLQLLCRAAIGAPLSSYSSWLAAPAGLAGAGGPHAQHLVVVDNGRGRILAGEFWEILLCLRCSSCLNFCPVYVLSGGHAYHSVYPGPMGSVLTALLDGQPQGLGLHHASTNCGLCKTECPMGIDLPGLLLRLRQREAPPMALLPGLAAQALKRRGVFEAACRLAPAAIRAIEALPESARPPGPWRAWTAGGRALPRPAGHAWLARRPREDGDG